jgi:hypothetical protein
MISSLKIKLIGAENLGGIGMCLSWKDLDEQEFNGIYLVRLGFRMWEILIFKVIFAIENSNKFQRTRFWKEKSVEDVVTLGPMARSTLVDMKRQN